jgi:hypothetical protein
MLCVALVLVAIVAGFPQPRIGRVIWTAGRWLTEIQVDSARGLFVDRSEAERHTLGQIISRYRDEILGEGVRNRLISSTSGTRRSASRR